MKRVRWQVLGSMVLGSALTLGVAATMQQARAQKTGSASELAAQELPPPPQQGGFGGRGGGFGGQGGPGGFGGPPGGGQGFGGPGGQGFGPGGQGRGMGMMGMGPAPSITATDKYVYILRGDQLLQYSADGLKLVAKTTLPRPEGQPQPGRPDGN